MNIIYLVVCKVKGRGMFPAKAYKAYKVKVDATRYANGKNRAVNMKKGFQWHTVRQIPFISIASKQKKSAPFHMPRRPHI